MIIETPAADAVDGHAAEMYASDVDSDGFVFSYTRLMAMNPAAHQAFESLIRALVPSIGIRVYEAATLGAARAIGSTHCLLAHGRKSLRAEVIDEAGLRAFAAGDDHAFSPAEQAVVRFAARVSEDPGSMTDADSQELRDAGFSDRQIVDIALAAGARNFFSRTLLALAVPVDEMPGLDPSLASALLRTAAAGGEHQPTADR